MTDSVLVFPPGFRVTDANDNPVNNAKIKFREIGPGLPKTVFSDATLLTALGTEVRTRSDGFPVVSVGSSTTTLIYVGNTPYNIEITDAFDVPIFPAKDNVKGAVDTSTFLTTGSTSTLNIPVLLKTANYVVQTVDKGKLIAANASGGFFTVTLPSAITVGDGWNIGIRNDGTANAVGVTAAHNISTSMGSITAFSLRVGETVWLESNGSTWKVSGYVPIIAFGTLGRFVIADRLSTPPVSPGVGARYIVTAAPTGAWATFAQHDIAEADGQGGWIRITPGAAGGWIAYVQSEGLFYTFTSTAWQISLASINTLAEETAIDGTADFFPFYDVSAALPRKGKPTNLKRSGGIQLLNSGTVLSAATLDIILTSFTGYRALKIVLSSFVPATDDVELWMRFSSDGGVTYDATGYSYAALGLAADSGAANRNALNDPQILIAGQSALTGAVSNIAARGGVDTEITLHAQQLATRFSRARFSSAFHSSNNFLMSQNGVGTRTLAQDTDAIRFLFEAGNIASGDWAIYGLI